MKIQNLKINTGISDVARKRVASELSRLLADTYTLYLKTQNFHWNVVGPEFTSLHLIFEQQYKELADAVDLIAERIRALDFPAPASFSDFIRLTSINEPALGLSSREMIQQLVEGHEVISRTVRSAFVVAEDAKDEATADLLTERLQVHENAAWMLRSLVKSDAAAEPLSAVV